MACWLPLPLLAASTLIPLSDMAGLQFEFLDALRSTAVAPGRVGTTPVRLWIDDAILLMVCADTPGKLAEARLGSARLARP